MTDLQNIQNVSRSAGLPDPASVFGRPDDIVDDSAMTTQEKRAVLASWASDVNAVPDVPSLRQLPDGSIVKLEDILRALQSLDATDGLLSSAKRIDRAGARTIPRRRGQWIKWRPGRGRSDDDDPPPCPATAAPRPGSSGGGAFASARPVAA